MNWLPMHSWHPLMIHLPLIALPMAVLADLLEARNRSHHLRLAGSVLWVLGLLGGMIAAGTGLLAYGRVDHSDLAHAAMTLHRNIALGTLALLLGVGLARWRWKSSKLVAVAGVLGLAGLVAVAILGGELVYRHAIGLPNGVLHQVIEERGAEAMDHQHDMGPTSAPPSSDDSVTAAPAATQGDSHGSTAHTHRQP